MNFGQNLYQWFLSNAQSLVLMAIVVIGIYLGFKREFSKLIGFLVVALIAVGLVFNAGGVKDVLLELFNKIIALRDCSLLPFLLRCIVIFMGIKIILRWSVIRLSEDCCGHPK